MESRLSIPCEVEYVLNRLENSGYEAFIVGGCVRDSLIGRIPEDWDVTTNALPVEIKALFDKTVDTGIKHGTVTILYGNMSIETTTYRVDGIYEDNRRPSQVLFTKSLSEDLSRRDFTINSMSYSPRCGFSDPFGGKNDIDARLIRTVGEADERFHEDALRMLRAVRFAARLNYDMHPDIIKSICKNSSLITNISKERIRDELTGILASDNPDKFALLMQTGLLQHIIPEFCCEDERNCNSVSNASYAIEYIWRALKAIENVSCLRWAVLIAGMVQATGSKANYNIDGKLPEKSMQQIQEIMRRLRFDKKNMQKTAMLVKFACINIEPCLKTVMKIVAMTGKELFEDLLKVKKSFIQAGHSSVSKLNDIEKIKKLYEEVVKNNYCFDLGCLAVNGCDIMELGAADGKTVGLVLEKLLDAVLDQPELNEKDKLVILAQKMLDI